MAVPKTFGRRTWQLLCSTLLLAAVASTLAAEAVFAQPPDVGEEPAGGPIIYNLVPSEGAVVERDELARAGATIETRRQAGVVWAEVFVDGQRRPSALMGATSYYQFASAYVGDLEPGIHEVRVIAVDTEGRAGGYAWTFTVV